MKIYVIFDSLLERVICVHEEEDMDCKDCRNLRSERSNTAYPLEECVRELVPSKRTDRNNKLDDIGI